MYWLTTCPIILLTCCLSSIDKLTAEESLRQVNVTAVGSGMMSRHARTDLLRGWERDAYGVVSPSRAKPLTPALAEAMGIGVVIEPAQVSE